MKGKKLNTPIIPLADQLVIIPDIPDFKTKSGIIIPDQAKKPPENGLAIAVGTDIEEVKAGDRIKFIKRTGNFIVLEGVVYLIMKEITVLGILTNK